MYVIGKSDYDFIKITRTDTMYDGQKIWYEIKNIEYETPLDKATIIPDYEKAVDLLKEIQDNAKAITFSNHSVIGQILDKESFFDKTSYSKELKIFELIPTII